MFTSDEMERYLLYVVNTLKGLKDVSLYKDYVLGLMFYKFISDKTLDTFKNLENLSIATERELIKKYKKAREEYGESLDNTIQSILGYYVLPEHLYQTWVEDINSGDFEIQKVADSLHNFEHTISDELKGLFSNSTIELTDITLSNNLNELNENIQTIILLFADLNMVELQRKDILGDAYEHLIGFFAMESGKMAGEFYTPHQVNELLARIVTQSSNINSIYDPTLGSGSLLLSVARYLEPPVRKNIKYYGQEINSSTYNLARMNLLIHGINPEKMTIKNGDALSQDWPQDPERPNQGIQFDAVVMNPPYSIKDWNRTDLTVNDSRFKSIGVIPPNSKGDFAFLLHGLFHLSQKGTMAIILPYGALFRKGVEWKIRKRLLEKNLIDTIIRLPSQLFINTGISTVVLILKKDRELEDPLLLIDGSDNFTRKGTKNVLLEKDVSKIVNTYMNRKNEEGFSYLVPQEKFAKWEEIPSFEQLKAKKQMENLETQYNKYKNVLFESVIEQFNTGSRNKHFKEIENSIYIPMIGLSNPVCYISELERSEHFYYQIVLKESINNQYLAAMFKSDLGKLILQSSKIEAPMPRVDRWALSKIIIPIPEMRVQKQIERTLDKLKILEKAINKFDKELALNPTTSIKVVDQLDKMVGILEELTDADYVRNLIRKGESKVLEFKETFSYDVRKKSKENYIEKAALKTLVGFLNSDGGTLLIGVNDEGIIKGINTEIDKLYKNHDRYLLNFKNAVKEKIGEIYYPFIDNRIIDIDEKLVLIVECKKSTQPCYFEEEEFYVRTNPATDQLTGRKMLEYVRSHFESGK